MALLNVLYVQLGTRCVLGTNAMCKPHVGLEVNNSNPRLLPNRVNNSNPRLLPNRHGMGMRNMYKLNTRILKER